MARSGRQARIPAGAEGLARSGPLVIVNRTTLCVPFSPRTGRRAMAVQALGYAGFGSAALDEWRQFGTRLVGLQAVERSPSLLAFRMDDRKQRIVIDRALPDGARFFGWEVADAPALDA